MNNESPFVRAGFLFFSNENGQAKNFKYYTFILRPKTNTKI